LPANEDELADFETDVLSGFELARASAGLIRDWFGRPLWEMQAAVPMPIDHGIGYDGHPGRRRRDSEERLVLVQRVGVPSRMCQGCYENVSRGSCTRKLSMHFGARYAM
jgi:hypothetical protein